MSRAPVEVQGLAAEILADQPQHRRTEFALRLDRWWADLDAGVRAVYGAQADDLARRLVTIAAEAYAERDPELALLDQRRVLEPDWFQQPAVFGYAAYAERFCDDLTGVAKKVDYLSELGVTYLHLMPLLTPRAGDSDGGYAVADYRTVRADLGTNEDLRDLARTLRGRNISLVVDLVLNHVAAEHEWAQRARRGEQKYRDYFRIFPDRQQPDAYEASLPEVFPDFAPGNFTWDDEVAGWVWTTFNTFQWDVNWANPDVVAEYAEIILFLANLGVEVLRLDAVAFLWKRLGTNCQNQPEVHAITQVLRSVARIAAPGVVFKAEAIVAPQDLVKYLGQREHHGKVSDLAYHNSLMVQYWSMIAAGDTTLAVHALRGLPPIPSTTAWMTYVRCHDDIGWAIDDGDAAAVGLNGHAHRAFLSDFYAGLYPTSFSDGLVFQYNPDTGDRRISGTNASLTGLSRAEAAGDAAATDLAVARILLGHALIAGWGGVPVVWMGDELGQPNDPDWAGETGHELDNRWAHRPRLDWDRAEQRHDRTTPAGRIFTGIAAISAARAGCEQLHASVASRVLEQRDPGVLAIVRDHPLGSLIGLYNVTATHRAWPAWRLAELGAGQPYDVLAGRPVPVQDDGNVWLSPYAAVWILDRPQ